MTRFLYALIFIVMLPVALITLFTQFIRRAGYKRGWGEFFGCYSAEKKARLRALPEGVIWVHAVSVGEMQLALTLVRKALAKNPKLHFLISCTTPTGREIAERQAPENALCIFAPLDGYLFVRSLLRNIKPSRLVIIETELWPEMIFQTAKSGAKIFIANARMSDRTAHSYKRLRFLFAPALRCFTHICAQSPQDMQRYLSVDPHLNCTMTGNMKFDQVIPESLQPVDLTPYFGAKPYRVIIGSSTHPGEETLFLDIFMRLKEKYADLKFISVPRHAERGDEIESAIRDRKLSFCRRSNATRSQVEPCDVLLADTTGELPRLIKASDIVLCGKTFSGHIQGQNPIEAALLKKVLLCGTRMTNFRFVFKSLRDAEALYVVNGDGHLYLDLCNVLEHPEEAAKRAEKAYTIIMENQGATDRTLALLSS